MPPLYVGAKRVAKCHLGATELDKVYIGEELLWARQPLPQISRFRVVPTNVRQGASLPGGLLSIEFDCANSTQVVVRNPSDIIRTAIRHDAGRLNGAVTETVPAADRRYTLTATNQEATITSAVTFYRTVAPAITGFTATYQGVHVQPGGVRLLRWELSGTITMHPWAERNGGVTISPENPTFGPRTSTLQRAITGSGDARSFSGVVVERTTSGVARPAETLTLRAVNPISGDSATATQTIQE